MIRITKISDYGLFCDRYFTQNDKICCMLRIKGLILTRYKIYRSRSPQGIEEESW